MQQFVDQLTGIFTDTSMCTHNTCISVFTHLFTHSFIHSFALVGSGPNITSRKLIVNGVSSFIHQLDRRHAVVL
jgi:hypothetical protein